MISASVVMQVYVARAPEWECWSADELWMLLVWRPGSYVRNE